MLLSEIRSSIINTAKGGGIPSDDTRLSSRLVNFWIRYHRAAIIVEATAFGKNYLPELIQDLGCLELTDIDKSEGGTSSLNVEWGCNIKKVEIPSLVDLPNDRALAFVGLIDKQTPFEVITAEQSSLIPFMMITNNSYRQYRIGTTLYIISPINKRLRYINVRGIFGKPEDVTSTDLQGTATCFNENTDDYPIPDRLVAKLIENIMKKELMLSITVSEDVSNDSVENNMTSTVKTPYAKQRRR